MRSLSWTLDLLWKSRRLSAAANSRRALDDLPLLAGMKVDPVWSTDTLFALLCWGLREKKS